MRCVIFVALAACAHDAAALPPAHGQFDLAYSDHSALDLYMPDGATAAVPLVIWVHGGAWRIGDKTNKIADKVALFNELGYAVASVNYRLSPAVMHPVHTADVGAAIDWLHDHALTYDLDRTRFAVLGHSAGAHLAALVSVDPTYVTRASIRCTGSFDTEAYDIPTALADANDRQRAILESAFGRDPEVHVAASPITYAGLGTSRFIVAVRGGAARRANQLAFASSVGAATINADGLSHEEVNARIGAAGDRTMTPPIIKFLAECFAN